MDYQGIMDLRVKAQVLTMACTAHRDLPHPPSAQSYLPLIHPRPTDITSVPGTHQAHAHMQASVTAVPSVRNALPPDICVLAPSPSMSSSQ